MLQFGTCAFEFRLKPRLIGMHLGMAVGQRPQLVEHGGRIPRHADLIGLGVVGLRPRLLQFVL